jgi:hypothetical protein
MVKKKNAVGADGRPKRKKKTSIGNSDRTKWRQPGPHGANKGYRKRYRGQGRRR